MTRPAYSSTNLTNHDAICVLALEGEHDIATVPRLEHQMQQLSGAATSVVIDLSQTTFIDSQVVGWLVRWSKPARRHSDHPPVAVVIGADGSFARRVIDLCSAVEMIPTHATTAEALASLERASPRPVTTTPEQSVSCR
jgi:anti-anti-sigma factor